MQSLSSWMSRQPSRFVDGFQFVRPQRTFLQAGCGSRRRRCGFFAERSQQKIWKVVSSQLSVVSRTIAFLILLINDYRLLTTPFSLLSSYYFPRTRSVAYGFRKRLGYG